MAKTDLILKAVIKIINSPRQRISEDDFKTITQKSKSSFYRYISELTKIEDADGVPLLRRIKDGDQYWFELNKSIFKYFIPEHLESAYYMEAFKALGYMLDNKQFNEDIAYLKKDIFQLNGRSKELEKKFYYLSKITTSHINEDAINMMITALISNKIISLEYSGKRYPKVYPLTLCQHRDALYLIGYKDKTGNIRTFKIDRVERVVIQEEQFKYPNKWCPEEYYKNTSGLINGETKEAEVKVFGESRQQFCEKTFFNSCLKKESKDHDTYTMKYTNENEFLGQLFVYAQDIEIVSPDDLKNRFIKKALMALQHNQDVAA